MGAEFPVVVERFTFFMAQSSTRYSTLSFDDLVRPRLHIGWNGEADLLSGFEIDHEIKLRRLLDRQIAGFGAYENFVDVNPGTAPIVQQIGSITHQSARFDKVTCRVDRR